MADQRIQWTDEMVGNGHATKPDTLNKHGMVEHASDGTHLAAYGSLYEYTPTGTVNNITTGGTYVKWGNSTAGESDGTFITVDATDDDMTIETGGAGVFDAYLSASVSGQAGMEVSLAIFVDGSRQDRLTRTVNLGGAHEHFPDSVDLKIGTPVTGTVSTMQSVDATYYQFSETNTPTGFIVDITFTGVHAPLIVDFTGRYSGNGGDDVECQIYDADTGLDRVQNGGTAYNCIRDNTAAAGNEPGVGADWTSYWEADGAASGEDAWVITTVYDDAFDEVRSATKDLPYSASTDYVRRWLIDGSHITRRKYSDSNEDCRIRFIHTTAGNATHDTFIDAISLQDDHAGASITVSDLIALTATDVVDARFTTNIDSSEVTTTNVNFKLNRAKKS